MILEFFGSQLAGYSIWKLLDYGIDEIEKTLDKTEQEEFELFFDELIYRLSKKHFEFEQKEFFKELSKTEFKIEKNSEIKEVLQSIFKSYSKEKVEIIYKDLQGIILEILKKEEYPKLYNKMLLLTVSDTNDLVTDLSSKVDKIIDNYKDINLDLESRFDFSISSLLGSWDENCEEDKRIISRYLANGYDKWHSNIKKGLYMASPIYKIKKGKWHILDREKLLSELGGQILDSTLNTLKKISIQVLSEIHPKFDLDEEQRFAHQIYGKVLTYSQELREGVAETLLLLKHKNEYLFNCTPSKINQTIDESVYFILENNKDWRLWASLDLLLPILAQASPDIFLKKLEEILDDTSDVVKKLFPREYSNLYGENFMCSLLWSLEVLAWDSKYLIRICNILGQLTLLDSNLGNWSNKPLNSLVEIMLPWIKNLNTTLQNKRVIIKTLRRQNPEVAWKVLLALLPNNTTHSTGIYKPKYIKINESENVLYDDYRSQIDLFIENILEILSTDLEKWIDFIPSLVNLNEKYHRDIIIALSSTEVLESKNSLKLKIRNSLEELIRSNILFAKDQIKNPIIHELKNISKKLESEDLFSKKSFLFNYDGFHLYETRGDYENQRKILDKKRSVFITEMLTTYSLEEIISFSKKVKYPFLFGRYLGLSLENEILPEYMELSDKKKLEFIKGYIKGKFQNLSYQWLDSLKINEWKLDKSIFFFKNLPFTQKTWDQAQKFLIDVEKNYWAEIDLFDIDMFYKEDLENGIDNLLKYNRPFLAISLLLNNYYSTEQIDSEKSILALKNALTCHEKPMNINGDNILDLIELLQKMKRQNLKILFGLNMLILNYLNIILHLALYI